MKTIKVGLDIGNSAVKGSILSEHNGLLKDVLIPSSVNYIHDVRHLDYPDRSIRYVQVLESPLEHTDAIVAIGNRAMDIPNYQQYDVGSTSYKTNHEITTSLLFGVIADAIGTEAELNVILAVSVPIVESKTYHLVDNYRNMLKGTHKLRVYSADGVQDVTVHIPIAQVLNEGQAGFLGLLDTVDREFLSTMNTLYAALGEGDNMVPTLEDFLVIDIGEGTTDLAVFRGKRFNAEYSYSVTKGYGTLLELAMANAERENLTIESRKQLQALLESENPRRAGQKKIWDKFVDVERKTYADEVAATILKTYGRQSFFDAIIFLGGGFSALTGYALSETGEIQMKDSYLFEQMQAMLQKNNKTAGVIFGVPQPFSQSINNRGLMQVLSNQTIRK